MQFLHIILSLRNYIVAAILFQLHLFAIKNRDCFCLLCTDLHVKNIYLVMKGDDSPSSDAIVRMRGLIIGGNKVVTTDGTGIGELLTEGGSEQKQKLW